MRVVCMYSFDWGSVIIARIEGIFYLLYLASGEGIVEKMLNPRCRTGKILESASFLPT
jgi:hypothetical protein